MWLNFWHAIRSTHTKSISGNIGRKFFDRPNQVYGKTFASKLESYFETTRSFPRRVISECHPRRLGRLWTADRAWAMIRRMISWAGNADQFFCVIF
jgi:hypothetical protein